MNALFKDIAESQKVSGIYYDANRQLQIGEVNLLKEAAKLNPQQRKVLILIKLADLADAKKSGDYQKVLKIAAELHDPRAKDTLADLVVEQLIRFGSGNLPLASASYQGAANIENSQTVTETRAALQTFFHDTFQSIVD